YRVWNYSFETLVKQPGAEKEHVLEKFRQELLAGLDKGAFRRRNFSGIKRRAINNCRVFQECFFLYPALKNRLP
ncbi:MAG: hypothetical protein J5I98_02505, partial [Phaeodactylibacter sp.]|nr:hypothetical protein [Phaeodactylibacter sp.]